MKAKSENGGKSVAINVRLSAEVYEDLKLIMEKTNATKTVAIERAIVDAATVMQLAELKWVSQ